MSAVEVRVPDLGEAHGVTVVEVLVKVGSAVRVDDPLVTLESDRRPWTSRRPPRAP